GPGGAHPEKGPDDAPRRHRGHDRVVFEPLLEEVGRAHGHELDECDLEVGGKVPESLRQRGQRKPLARVEAAGVRRHYRQDRLDEPDDLHDQLPELVVGLGVVHREPPQLVIGAPGVVRHPQIVAVQRREAAVEGEDLQVVAGELELTDDLWPEQRDHVGGHAEPEPGEHFLGHRGAAHQVPALQHEDPLDIEYNAVREGAGLIDVSPLFKYLVSGPDAVRLINRIITRDARKLQVDQVYYTPWCDERGKLIDDGTVCRLDESTYRWTAAEPNYRWFNLNASGLDVRVEDISGEVG